MEKIRVLEMMGEGIAHGGEEAFISNILTNMDMEGLEIDWLTPYQCKNQFYREQLGKKGGRVFEFGLSYVPGKSRRHIIAPLNTFFSEHHYDVVHIHSGSISVLSYASQIASKHGIKKIIVHSHLGGKKSVKSAIVKAAFSPLMVRYPTIYMACSMEAANMKFPPQIVNNQLILINNGINLEKYIYDPETNERIRTELNIPEDARVIGHVGRFNPEKNHQYIIKCFKKVLEKERNCYLLFVGDGELLEDIKQKTRELSIEDNVRFAGYVNNISDYYKAMNLFVFPSLYEGFPISALEAQATGIPCIISDKIDKDTAVCPNVYSLPIENSDVEKWVDTICEHLYEAPLEQQALLKSKGFDIKDTANQIRKIYME